MLMRAHPLPSIGRRRCIMNLFRISTWWWAGMDALRLWVHPETSPIIPVVTLPGRRELECSMQDVYIAKHTYLGTLCIWSLFVFSHTLLLSTHLVTVHTRLVFSSALYLSFPQEANPHLGHSQTTLAWACWTLNSIFKFLIASPSVSM